MTTAGTSNKVGLPIPSFIAAAMNTTVQINGLRVPFNSCVTNLQRFCRPVAFHNDDPLYEASCAGSSFLLQYRKRNVLLCAEHQLGTGEHKRKPNDIMIIIEDDTGGKVGLTPNGVTEIAFHHDDTKTLNDVILVEYASDRNGRDISRHFFQLSNDTPDLRAVSPERIILIFAIGYPSQFSSFETQFDADFEATSLEITTRWCKLYLELAEQTSWDVPFHLPLRLHTKFDATIGDPDGFSGSPVFFIYQDDGGQTHLGFAGMITHANKEGRFMIYEGGRLMDLVNRLAKEKPLDGN